MKPPKQWALFTARNLTRHCRKRAGVTNNISDVDQGAGVHVIKAGQSMFDLLFTPLLFLDVFCGKRRDP